MSDSPRLLLPLLPHPPLRILQRQLLHLLQGDSKHAAEREALRETVRDADSGAAQFKEIERRFAARKYEDELAREVFAVVGVEVEGLEVVAEVHRAQGW